MVGRDNARMTGAYFLAAAATGWLGIAPASAQDDGSVTVDVRRCVEIPSPEERIACFGAQVDQALQEQGEAPPTPSSHAAATGPAPAETASSAAPAEPLPGAEAANAPASAARVANGAPAPVEFVSTVADLRVTVPNSYVITLENGQVWRQMRPKWYPLRLGQRVRVHSTGWGDAYRLTIEDTGGFIQVERVR